MRFLFPPEKTARTEAAAWFARLNTHSVSSDTLEEFRVWRQRPGNRSAYSRLEKLWRDVGALSKDKDVDDALTEAVGRGEWRRKAGRPLHLSRRSWALAGLGVAMAAVAAVAVGIFPIVVGETYATRIGEQRLIGLDDGSRIRLDTQTRLVVRFSRRRRDVRLVQGQAFFDVAHDVARPFFVEAGPAAVRAVGTRFDVRRDDGQVRVTLIQGIVQVRTAGGSNQALTLTPGESVTAGRAIGAPTAADVTAVTSWTSGRIVFHAVPLRVAIAEVNRYSRHKVVLRDDRAGGLTVTGAFDSGDTDAFVSGVTDLYGLKAASETNGAIILSMAPPP